jgi:hypothetical protein
LSISVEKLSTESSPQDLQRWGTDFSGGDLKELAAKPPDDYELRKDSEL